LKKPKAWTTARKKAFIIAALRSASQRYPPKYETLNKAKVGKEVNKATGRIAEHYKCASCKEKFVLKNVQVDHILPVVSTKEGFVNWNIFIESLFCEAKNLQVLCKPCHATKTALEREKRKQKCS
jgi:5-methylcytosine-specific restriction endonuclease McrA